MGTTYTVKYVPPHGGVRRVAQAAVDAALEAVNTAMSTYDPKSEISLINRTNIDSPMPLSAALAEVVAVAKRVHTVTGGAFDPTVAPLVRAYGFGPDEVDGIPSEEDLAPLKERVGMQYLRFDQAGPTLQKVREGVELDLGGIAKGFGVDKAAEALEDLGIEDYMVEVGGEIRVLGTKPEEKPWVLAIEKPKAGERRIHGTLSLPASGGALATSGDYRNFKKHDGETVTHTFDPTTKEPALRRTASASVVRPTAVEADALATAMMVLEPERAMQIANREGYAVYLLTHAGGDFEAHESEAFSRFEMDAR